MKKKLFLLPTMAVLPFFCSCGSKTQSKDIDNDSVALATENVSMDKSDISIGTESQSTSDKYADELVIEENGVENLRLGMKKSQVLKSVPGLYDSFTEEENEVEDFIQLDFRGKRGTITAMLDGDVISMLTFNVTAAVTSDGKLRIGMKLSDAIASGSYTFVAYPYSGIDVEAANSHFSFELPADALTNATRKYFDREGEDVTLKARPDMVKPSAKIEAIVVN